MYVKRCSTNDDFIVALLAYFSMCISKMPNRNRWLYDIIQKTIKILSLSRFESIRSLSICHAWFVCWSVSLYVLQMLFTNSNTITSMCTSNHSLISCRFINQLVHAENNAKIELIQWSMETSVPIQLNTNYNQSLFTWRTHEK